LDAALLLALIAAPPQIGPRAGREWTRVAVSTAGALAWCGVLLATGITDVSLNRRPPLWGTSREVYLNPRKWTGTDCPIAPHLTPPVDLTTGDWLVLMYRANCSACRQDEAKYEHLTRDWLHRPGNRKVLALELPPYAGPQSGWMPGGASGAIHARLDPSREWVANAPDQFVVRGGKVTADAELDAQK
jgi:hypothetical protein